jgi:predicted extracellular nuclease
VHYQRGHFEVLPVSLPALGQASSRTPLPVPRQSADRLRVASANLLNLSATDDDRKFERLASLIVRDLGAPELVALQEVQDDSGPEDDGEVGARATLGKLVDAIAAAGGPSYRWLQVDPMNNADGGQPGGNIRVALLFDPQALALPARPAPASERPVVEVGEDGGLAVNPALLDAPAFRGNGGDDWSNSRKPLVAQLTLAQSYAPEPTAAADPGDRSLFVIAVHFSSKGPDDSEWSSSQPPRRLSEAQRVAQAEAVAALVEDLLGARPNARVVVVGALNEYAFRPPLAKLKESGLTNLTEQIPEEHRYSYIFRGNSMLLDHILVSPALSQNAEIAAVHVHADQPQSRQTSDHDPLVASLAIR